METVEKYRVHVQKLLEKYGYFSSNDDVETQIITDEKHDHYQLVHVGWRNNRRTYGCVLHIDIKNDKIWIQHDGTEIGMANEFVALGVPKEDIVLAFHAPYKRQYTGFAIG
ncbi:MAG: XisI protein [Thiomargarita sp.]|nr:XisI protein [Thiomargarita sp.]